VNLVAPFLGPGRVCPVDYRYEPQVLARRPEIRAPALYVAGGVYGNLQALRAADAMAGAEAGAVLVLNGDFHWFDAEPAWFAAIEATTARHLRLRGNVETEVARGVAVETGCGCAYPAAVDDATVRRSNAIIADLAKAADPTARRRMAGLPMHLVAEVGGARIGIVHGDAQSLAGWRFDPAALDEPGARDWLAEVRAASGCHVFACAHTCSPGLRRFAFAADEMVVANNGAAGMPNGPDIGIGIVVRIGVAPSPVCPLAGTRISGVHVDLLPLAYDHGAFLETFDARWPAGSPAEQSYRARIVDGCGAAQPLSGPRP
jgi:hypothetical protein